MTAPDVSDGQRRHLEDSASDAPATRVAIGAQVSAACRAPEPKRMWARRADEDGRPAVTVEAVP